MSGAAVGNATGPTAERLVAHRRRLGRIIHGDIRSRTRPCPLSGHNSCGSICARGRITTACRGALACQSRHGAFSKVCNRRFDHRSPAWRRWRWFPRRWWRRLPRRRVSWRWFQGRRCCVSWRRVQGRWHGDPSRRVSRRAGLPWRRHALRVSPRLSPAAFLSPASLPPPVLRGALLRLPVLLWLPAPLLPRDLDLLRAAQDLPLSSVASPSLARSLLWIPVSLLVRREMKQAPDRAPVFLNAMNAASIPILAAPRLDPPGRQRLHLPLFPVLRRPMTET